jgi:hypothetical protein
MEIDWQGAANRAFLLGGISEGQRNEYTSENLDQFHCGADI